LDARTGAGLSQKALGILAGLDPSVASPRINQYERGVHAPSYSFLAAISRVLKVPVAYFYCQDEDSAVLLLAYSRATLAARGKAKKALGLE
jgi:transcriptional regulator with XRE-family HTH domain